ncbi:MAG: SDR family oxidoreductase [Anaerolineae bacterium]|jgi:NAD(P)-dependent dehydrogenase (short-subunit alcohol dehydrogenase family)
MNNENTIAIVTGANRGIGFETCRQLARRGIQVMMTSRDEAKGQAAQQKLANEGLEVAYHQLDVTDSESIQRLANDIRQQYGHLDALINNAGVLIDQRGVLDTDLDTVRTTMEANVYGPWRLVQALVPLMKQGGHGRIVNLSSGMGQLSDMGSGSPAYRMSKTALNALTCMLAAELRQTNILVNSMCPGWVKTDMGGSGAPRSVEQGADTAAWLATLPDDGPTGGFFRDREPIPW